MINLLSFNGQIFSIDAVSITAVDKVYSWEWRTTGNLLYSGCIVIILQLAKMAVTSYTCMTRNIDFKICRIILTGTMRSIFQRFRGLPMWK